jgi:hypothetical protein
MSNLTRVFFDVPENIALQFNGAHLELLHMTEAGKITKRETIRGDGTKWYDEDHRRVMFLRDELDHAIQVMIMHDMGGKEYSFKFREQFDPPDSDPRTLQVIALTQDEAIAVYKQRNPNQPYISITER